MALESDFVVSDEDGALELEPAPAVPLGLELELDGLVLDEDEDDPPLALSFLFRSIEVEDELEPEGALLGEVVAPAGEVADELDERSAPRSHAVISVAPSARETATAIVDILMGPPWLGYWKTGANIGPRLLNHHRFKVSAASVLGRLRVARLGTRAVIVRTKIATLRGVLRIDLTLRRARALALLCL